MAREFAKAFYDSELWKNTREFVLQRDGGLCRTPGCYKPATDVHHIKWLTPKNINDPNVAVNPDNLISLCWMCHRNIHGKNKSQKFDENGYLIADRSKTPPGGRL